MTYHQAFAGKLVGFGADDPSPEDKVLAYATATGCPGMLPRGCFDAHMAQVKSQCAAHLPPPAGATQVWWNAFCNKLSTCGFPSLCASDESELLAALPKCADADTVKFLAYVDQYRVAKDGTPSGPDRNMNAAAVAFAMSPAVQAKLRSLPPCTGQAPKITELPPPAAAPPPPALPAPPPPDYTADVVPDATPVTVSDATPPPSAALPAQPSSSGSSSRYVLYGLLGAALLGGAYFAFRK